MCGLWYLVTWRTLAAGGSRGNVPECWHGSSHWDAAVLMAHHLFACCHVAAAIAVLWLMLWLMVEVLGSFCVVLVTMCFRSSPLALGWRLVTHQIIKAALSTPGLASAAVSCVVCVWASGNCFGGCRCTIHVLSCSLRCNTCWQVALDVAMT